MKTLATGSAVTRVAFSRDGSLLLAVSADVTVRVWRTSGWKRATIFRDRFRLSSADLSPDGRFVATADADGVVRLRALANPNRQRWTSARGRPIDVVAFSPDGSMLVTAGADRLLAAGGSRTERSGFFTGSWSP